MRIEETDMFATGVGSSIMRNVISFLDQVVVQKDVESQSYL
jgi:hypothetical protein